MGAELSQIDDRRPFGSSAVGGFSTSRLKLNRAATTDKIGSRTYGKANGFESVASMSHGITRKAGPPQRPFICTTLSEVPRRNSLHSQHEDSAPSGSNTIFAGSGIGNFLERSLFQSKWKGSNINGIARENECSATSEDLGACNNWSQGLGGANVDDDQVLESLDIPVIEWEGYVTKRGHLVRNWKMRFFTLEGNRLSYYENKVDAQKRAHLKGRVKVASVKQDKISRWGNGFEFTFTTVEGKIFHCSVPTQMDQLLWVYFLEAGVGLANIKISSEQVMASSDYRHNLLPNRDTKFAYDLVRRILEGDNVLLPDFMAYFNKDLVFTSAFPDCTPLQGDFFGREGILNFIAVFVDNFEILEHKVMDIRMDDRGKAFTFKGKERVRSRSSGEVIQQKWTHRISYGPYGRVLRLKIEVDSDVDWKSLCLKTPYSETSTAAVRSNRALSISLKDFNVYNVIGKGGFGTVVNAVKKSDGQIYAIKILEKNKMTKYDIESSFTEMRVAQNIHHPFVAGLRIAFQSRTKLFLGMNYYGGGDLFHHMSQGKNCRIPPERAHFYTAELVLGIHHLHKHNILYRDIKPENVMIDGEGHIALVDFGLAKLHVSEYKGAKTMAGSPQYTAPELLLPKSRRSYGKAADWWSLGILLYEMSVGNSPFYDNNVEKMYKKIQHEPLNFPSRPALSNELKDILIGFLQKDPVKRLGIQISDILKHPYFASIDWDMLLQRQIAPPWKPQLSSPLDVRYVDNEFTELDPHREVLSPTEKSKSKGNFFMGLVSIRSNRKSPIPPAQDPAFKDFTYYCENPDALVEVEDLVDELHPEREPLRVIEEDIRTRPPKLSEMSFPSDISKASADYCAGVLAGNDIPLSMDEMSTNDLLNSPDSASASSSSENADPYEAIANDPNLARESSITGTPLTSFLEQGSRLSHQISAPTSSENRAFPIQSGLHRLEVEMIESFGRVEVTLSRPHPSQSGRKQAAEKRLNEKSNFSKRPPVSLESKPSFTTNGVSSVPTADIMEAEF